MKQGLHLVLTRRGGGIHAKGGAKGPDGENTAASGGEESVRLIELDFNDGSTVSIEPTNKSGAITADLLGSDVEAAKQALRVLEQRSPFAEGLAFPPFTEGLAFSDYKITPSKDFSKEACVRMAQILFVTTANHHGFPFARELFSTTATVHRPPHGLTKGEREILRRYAAMKKQNITLLAKEMGKTRRHVQRVISDARRRYGAIQFSLPRKA
jgi:hypothetical protein